MAKIIITIDNQRTRKQFRLRVMKGREEAVAIYFKSLTEAQRVKRMLRKTINGLLNIDEGVK